MIDLYFWPTGNGKKIVILLEELGLAYTIKPINIGRGDQLAPEFLKISPNGRMPAIVDDEPMGGGARISIFESGPIMMYLAERPDGSTHRIRAANTMSLNGSAGNWPIRVPSWASKAISDAPPRAETTAISTMPCAASTMKRIASSA